MTDHAPGRGPLAHPTLAVSAASRPDTATERMHVDVTVAYDGPDGATLVLDSPWSMPVIVHDLQDGDQVVRTLPTLRPTIDAGAVSVSAMVFEPELLVASVEAEHGPGDAVRLGGHVAAEARPAEDGGVVLGVRFGNTDSTGEVEAVLSGPGFEPVHLGTVAVDDEVEHTIPLGVDRVEAGEVSVRLIRVVDFGSRLRPESSVFTGDLRAAFAAAAVLERAS